MGFKSNNKAQPERHRNMSGCDVIEVVEWVDLATNTSFGLVHKAGM